MHHEGHINVDNLNIKTDIWTQEKSNQESAETSDWTGENSFPTTFVLWLSHIRKQKTLHHIYIEREREREREVEVDMFLGLFFFDK